MLFNATETKAGSPGGSSVPDWPREWEIQKIKHAQEANVCTLNEFRQHLGLKRASALTLASSLSYVWFTGLESFEEWNRDLAHTASELYDGDINKLELYVRLTSLGIILADFS